MRSRFRVLIALAISIVAFAGCDSRPRGVTTHRVSGQVLYGGAPAAGVHVFLLPTSAPTVPEVPNHPYGVTGTDGRFTLTTYKDGDGAPEGGYQVLLRWPPEVPEEEEKSKDDRLHGWYSATTSKLTVEVKPGDNQIPTLDLPVRKGPPPKSEGVPGRN